MPNSNSWNLDALGNWSSGNGSTNAFNAQNEETTTNSGSTTLTYDNAGEMTRDELGNGYTFDAWGHVISTTSATFQFDALGRNVISNTGTGNQPTFYDAAGRQIQVFLSYNRGIYTQNVWGLAYVNDLILRDRNADTSNTTGSLGVTGSGLEERIYAQHDEQFSVISLTSSSGTVLQRFAYDPYGADIVLTASWTAGTDGYSWICTFQGMTVVVNGNSHNLLESDTRLYDVDLGRWTSEDKGYWDGLNLYQADRSNPPRFSDFSGLVSGVSDSATGSGFGISQWPGTWQLLGAFGDFVLTPVWNEDQANAIFAGGLGSTRWWATDFGERMSATIKCKGIDPTDIQEAARHMAWQAELARLYGANNAKTVGDLHEWHSPDHNDSRRDQANNGVGRQIGAYATSREDVERRVEDAIRNGRGFKIGPDGKPVPLKCDCDSGKK